MIALTALLFGFYPDAAGAASGVPKESIRFASNNAAKPAASFQGYLDYTGCDKIYGWAWDSTQPNSAVTVAIWDGTNFLATVSAGEYRPDLPGNKYHAFNYVTPSSLKDGQTHSIRATIAGYNVELTNSPKSLTCSPVDSAPPTINSFSVNQTSISPGGTFTFSYAISDSGGSGLNRAELFRAPDNGGAPGTWSVIKTNTHSGNGPTSSTFTDSPSATGAYWYGLHVFDNSGNVRFEPDPPGPIRVTVSSACTQPSIITHPADQSISGGQQATLSVSVSGSGPFSYQWYQGSSGNISNPVSGATSSSLTVQPTGTTTYWARVSNSCGSASSNAATVYVNSTTLPDLTITAGVASGYASGQNNVQSPVTVYRTGGSLPDTGVYVLARLYWSASSSYSSSATLLWESNGSTPDYPVSVLNSSGSKGVTATFNIPAVASTGTYYILAYVDPPTSAYPNGYYSESNKSNNVTAYPVSVSVTSGPFISVNPSSGPQLTTTFVTSGTGFSPNGKVRRFLIFPNTVSPQEIAGTTADGAGQFKLTFTTDCSTQVGPTTEYFIDVGTGRQSNSVTENVTATPGCSAPTISISPQSGPQLTTTFTIIGSGFTQNGAVRELVVFPDGVTREAAGTTTNGQGQISVFTTTDCGTAAGSYTIWMIDVATGKESTRAQEVVTASATCSAAPTLQASQPSGQLGTTFGYTGAGFTRNSTATLTITRGDSQPGNGGRYNTDGGGNVSFLITSQPNDPTGTWTMRLTDDSTGRQASTSVQYTSAQQTGQDVMYYTASTVDVTMPDNTQLAPGETRNKIWRIQNAGSNSWTNYKLVFVPGTVAGNQSVNLSPMTSVTLSAAPGQWVNTPDLPITAPKASGTYYSYWQMQNSSGVSFGARIYVKIRVAAPQSSAMGFGSRSGGLGTGDSPKSKSGHNADPVNTATGNYNYETSDLRVPGRGLDFEFGRAYNSQDATVGPLGRGWSHSFNIYLTGVGTATPAVHYSDGKVLAYVNQYGTSDYESSYQGYYDKLSKNADNTWTLKKSDQRLYRFDAAGRLAAIQDRSGNQIVLAYDAAGNLTQISDTVGRTYRLAYSGKLLTSVTDPTGRTLQFGYDASSNQTSFRDANNSPNSYLYEGGGSLTKIIDGRGNNLLVNTYDANNRVATQTNGRGYRWFFTYNADGTTSVLDPYVKETKYTHDTNFNMQREADRLKNQTDVRYDDRNNRSQISDLRNNYFSFQYDAAGNVTAQTDPLQNTVQAVYDARNNPTQVTNQLGAKTQMGYDQGGNLTSVTDTLGNSASTTYNAFGQPLVTTDANGNATTRAYDAAGNLVSVKDALNNTTAYSYDAVGRRTSVTDARGKTTSYTYDANDNLLTVTDPAGGVTTYTYDANGNRTSVRDARGNTTRYEYDENNLLVKELDPAGNFMLHTYDKLDRRASTRDKRGHITLFAYDDEGRLVTATDPLGNATTYTYDANGNRTSVTDAKGQSNTFAYDALNHETKVRDPLGNAFSKEYDKVGRLTREVDAGGNATQFTYDPAGNLTRVLDAAGGTAVYGYDKDRNRTSQTDPNNNTSQFGYDKLNRLISARDPLGNIYTYTYDEAGNRASQTDAKGQTTRYEYDPANRLLKITYPDSSAVRFVYDANGNVTQMVDALGTTAYDYDQLNRLTRYTDVYGKTVGYQYDENGNLTALTYPDGKQVTYKYDAANRLTSLTDWAGKTTTYEYDPTGLLTKIRYPSNFGTSTTFTYDAAGRLIRKADDPEISTYDITLDAAGNRTSVRRYSYVDNRIVAASGGATYDAANRVKTAGAAAFGFDANGNLTSKTEGGVTTSYVYDFNDRLVAAGGAQYFYNGQGVRVKKVEGGVTTRYVVDINHDLSQVLAETDAGGAISSYYVYGVGLAYKVTPDGRHFYYHFDPAGSTVALTDDGAAIYNGYLYDAFGKVSNSFELTPNPFKFVGQYGVMEDANGLLYMRARYYMPEVGRFMNKDREDRTSGEFPGTQNLNLFTYTENNPINAIDPEGLTPAWLTKVGNAAPWLLNPIGTGTATWVRNFVSANFGKDHKPRPDQQFLPFSVVDSNIEAVLQNPSNFGKVFPHGAWDYKYPNHPEYEDFGNFNYGAVCRAAHIARQLCLSGAAIQQFATGRTKVTWWLGDDPQDQAMIKAGMDYFEEYKKHRVGTQTIVSSDGVFPSSQIGGAGGVPVSKKK